MFIVSCTIVVNVSDIVIINTATVAAVVVRL